MCLLLGGKAVGDAGVLRGKGKSRETRKIRRVSFGRKEGRNEGGGTWTENMLQGVGCTVKRRGGTGIRGVLRMWGAEV